MEQNKDIETGQEAEGFRHKAESEEQMPEPLPDPKPSTPDLQPANKMEVHHHGHVHHQKKWKEYIFQFFMLFLAVFCGFLAEYQLEHVIEHNREKEYIVSLVEDLKLDTASLNNRIQFTRNVSSSIDSLLFYLYHPEIEKHTNKIYYGIRGILAKGIPFNNHDRTVTQLKNAGGLRLIRNKSVSDSIIIYDSEELDWIRVQEASILDARNRCRDLIGNIFDAKVLIESTKNSFLPAKLSVNSPLFSKDPLMINQFAVQALFVRSVYNNTELNGYQHALHYATRLIQFIQKEYHLE